MPDPDKCRRSSCKRFSKGSGHLCEECFGQWAGAFFPEVLTILKVGADLGVILVSELVRDSLEETLREPYRGAN